MKKDIIAALQKRGFSNSDADTALTAVAESIRDVAQSGPARIPGFGTFEFKTSAERQGRNPATGEAITILPKRQLKFREAKQN